MPLRRKNHADLSIYLKREIKVLNKLDMSLLDFVNIYTQLIDTVVKYRLSDDYRICITQVNNNSAEIDIYPPSDESTCSESH